MKASDMLRRAADAVDDHVLHDGQERRVKLAALHILGMCGAKTSDEALDLLVEMLDE